MKTNTDYKNAALAALKGNWAKAVLATVVFAVIAYLAMGPYMYYSSMLRTYMTENVGPMTPGNISQRAAAMMSLSQDPEFLALSQKANGYSALCLLLSIFLVWPVSVGILNAFRRLLTGGENDILGNTFKSATKDYWHKVWGMFLMFVFVFLWSLLLIIPGIVKIFSYAMTPFILDENPELSANDAIDRSRAMMKGHKFDLFWLLLSFIGWFILTLLTLGIGGLWLQPYMQTSVSAFYEDVKAEYEATGGLA